MTSLNDTRLSPILEPFHTISKMSGLRCCEDSHGTVVWGLDGMAPTKKFICKRQSTSALSRLRIVLPHRHYNHHLHFTRPQRRFTKLHFLLLHGDQSLVLGHRVHFRPTWIPDSANERPAHLAVGSLVELADERFVKVEAEQGR